MKKQLIWLSSLCLLLSSCDMNTDKKNVNSQIESEADRNVTQAIRQSLLDDATLSIDAKNIKIITKNGVVTLRGPVSSEKEKSDIGKKAKDAAGVKTVDNQLEFIVIEKEPAAPVEAEKPKS